MFNNPVNYVMAAGILLMVWVLMRQRLKRSAAPAPAEATVKFEKPMGTGLSDAPLEVLRWEVAMHDLARDLKAGIDSKASALQTLIKMAREESDRLEAALQRARDERSQS